MAKVSILDKVVERIAGSEVISLARTLKKNKKISEFKLTTMIKQDINVTRNMLYRLYDANLVSFTRKKDKKKGWYIYYWTLNEKQIPFLEKDIMRKKIEQLQDRLDREQKSQYFFCDSKCVRLDFDQATEFEFKCPECNELLSLDDNSETIKNIKKDIEDIKKKLNKPEPKARKKTIKKKVKKKSKKAKKKSKKKR